MSQINKMSTVSAPVAETKRCICCENWFLTGGPTRCLQQKDPVQHCPCCRCRYRFGGKWAKPPCMIVDLQEKNERRKRGDIPRCGDCLVGYCTRDPNTCPFVQEKFGEKDEWPVHANFAAKDGKWIFTGCTEKKG
jgi:hypothetical protein